jgi:hypothetical protein
MKSLAVVGRVQCVGGAQISSTALGGGAGGEALEIIRPKLQQRQGANTLVLFLATWYTGENHI